MHWVVQVFPRVTGRIRNLIGMLLQKSDLILLPPISFQLEFQTGQRCVPCAISMPCQSLSIGHYTHFETINPKAFLSKQVFVSASIAVFIFLVFFTFSTLANCIIVKRVRMFPYVHAHVKRVCMFPYVRVQVCVNEWRPEADIGSLSQSLSRFLTEAGSRWWT